MLIVCDNCGAEYEVDVDDDVGSAPGRGLRFRCNACGHTFSISDDSAHSSELGSDGAGASAPSGESGPPPMLLKQEGKVYQVEDVATLQRWIVERRVLREDLLSIGGLKWEPVGGRRDLQIFFHLVEHAERLSLTSGGGGGAPPPLADLPDRDPVEGRAPWEAGPPGPPVEEGSTQEEDLAATTWTMAPTRASPSTCPRAWTWAGPKRTRCPRPTPATWRRWRRCPSRQRTASRPPPAGGSSPWRCPTWQQRPRRSSPPTPAWRTPRSSPRPRAATAPRW
ncbi:zinc-ribbon domain-containing protein [Myxococcota bacterium]|nr:zinc-ribbon domain-containing protein [Myxococcota bacterium]